MRKKVIIQLAPYVCHDEKFYGAKVETRKWNQREKNAAKKMAEDFVDYLYHNATGQFYQELKKALKKKK